MFFTSTKCWKYRINFEIFFCVHENLIGLQAVYLHYFGYLYRCFDFPASPNGFCRWLLKNELRYVLIDCI